MRPAGRASRLETGTHLARGPKKEKKFTDPQKVENLNHHYFPLDFLMERATDRERRAMNFAQLISNISGRKYLSFSLSLYYICLYVCLSV